jgi:AcrR family transcriptional regulator
MARRSKVEDSAARTALLDGAEAIMVEEGYAAVSIRRIATRAGLNSALVYYYFDTMDGLFVALFRRGAERSLQRQREVLASPQPLWGLWELTHERSSNALTMEFLALANHRKAIRAEIADYSRKFRRMQVEQLTDVLEGYGIDVERWPPASILMFMAGISRYLLMEEAFDLDIGHAETVAVVERHLRELEGDWITSGVSAERPSSTVAASASASGAGGKCGFGTATTASPAAAADRMPFDESSMATQRAGAAPSRSTAAR